MSTTSELLKALGIGAGTIGAGAALHGAGLGRVLEPLDYPRQALYNLIRSPMRALESGDVSDLLGALPGLAGATLGGVVGGPVGVLAGSLLGGSLQGMGNLTGRKEFNAPTVEELTGTDAFLPNMAVGMATDPLTYAGLGSSWKAGAQALQGAKAAKTATAAKALEEAMLPVAAHAPPLPIAAHAPPLTPEVTLEQMFGGIHTDPAPAGGTQPIVPHTNETFAQTPQGQQHITDTIRRYDDALQHGELAHQFAAMDELRSMGIDNPHEFIMDHYNREAGITVPADRIDYRHAPLPENAPREFTQAEVPRILEERQRAMHMYFDGPTHGREEARALLRNLGYQDVDHQLEIEFMRRRLAGEHVNPLVIDDNPDNMHHLGGDEVFGNENPNNWMPAHPDQFAGDEGLMNTHPDAGQHELPGYRNVPEFQAGTPVPGYHSRLENAINALPDTISLTNAKGKQQPALLAQLKNVASKIGGLSDEEVALTGIDKYLQGKKSVTKDELLKFFKENEVQVHEIMKSDRLLPEGQEVIDRYGLPSRYDKPKFTDITTPGAIDNRELLLTLPSKGLPEGYTVQEVKHPHAKGGKGYEIFDKDGGSVYNMTFPTEQQALDYDKSRRGFKYTHWDEPNVVAHIRFNDRVGPNGEKILHIEEIQSDWHQQGKKMGYMTPENEAYLKEWTEKKDRFSQLRDEASLASEIYGDKWQENVGEAAIKERAELSKWLDNANDETWKRFPHGALEALPNAPFKDTWHELSMKRMIRYAAEHDYDAITLNTGENIKRMSGGKIEGQKAFYGTAGDPKKVADAEKLMELTKDWNPQAYADAKAVRDKNVTGGGTVPNWMKKYAKQHGVHVDMGTGSFKIPEPTSWKQWSEAIAQIPDEAIRDEAGYLLGDSEEIPQITKMLEKFGIKAPVDMLPVTQMTINPSMRHQAMTKGFPLLQVGAGAGGSALLAALLNQENS